MNESSARASAQVVHHIPGRVRLRVPHTHRTPDAIGRLREELQSVPGVRRVDVNAVTGSMVVHHDPNGTSLDEVNKALGAAGEFALDLVPPRMREQVRGEVSLVAHDVRNTVAALDGTVRRATGGWLDLKMLVPLAFVGAAAVQITLSEGAWTAVPPYVLLYYGFDTFMKFHSLTPANRAALISDTPDTAP